MNSRECTKLHAEIGLSRKLQLAQSFIREILGRTEPVEGSTEVLDFLIVESERFNEGTARRRKLLSVQLKLTHDLKAEIESLRKLLSACGLNDQDTKFRPIEVASCFADIATSPSVLSLALSYVEDFENMQALEASYHFLLKKSQDLQSRSLRISESARTVSKEKLQRMEEDTTTRTIATRTIKEQASLDQRQYSNVRLPSLNCGTVTKERQKLMLLQEELSDREVMLGNLSNLPNDLDHVFLEIDRMQRRLQKLEQHRSDLYRSIRR